MIKAPRGTRDLLPPDTDLWNRVEAKVREVLARYNYREIRTPVFEDTQLFSRSVGEETDIVSKEMFTFVDRGRAQTAPDQSLSSGRPQSLSGGITRSLSSGSPHSLSRGSAGSLLAGAQSLTLRPENTAGVVRAYIEHGLYKTGTLQKLYYIGPQFRRERPQKGRYRQFYQIGAEIIGPPSAGSESPARDAEVLEMLATLLDDVGLRDWQLQLNSVGCAADRVRYNKALREALAPVVSQMCEDCRRRAETNALRVLDCKVPEDQPIIEKLPKISEYLDDPCREHFAAVRGMLDAVGISYTINERMVRGLDYYTRTTFEFTHGGLGSQNSVLGGGRYDGLSESLDGPKAPGIGFAIGEDRLILASQSQGETAVKTIQAYVAPLGTGMNVHALRLARDIRRAGVSADLGDESFRLKKSFELAEKAGARFIVIVGENEVASDQFAVKDLASGQQVQVPRYKLAEHLRGARQDSST
jgi:histidyl-tRNA synthetase